MTTLPSSLNKPSIIWLCWATALLMLFWAFKTSLSEMLNVWLTVEEYSHGIFIPLISLYFIWLRKNELVLTSEFKQSIPGLLLILLGTLLYLLAILAAFSVVELYAFLLVFVGFFTTAFGVSGLRIAFVPLFFMVFMIPFPPFILSNLSIYLQLISSRLGVEIIRACHIMVFLEGNVIDLGSYRLQVVEACSGLRYLFPLSSLGFLCAYLFKGPYWQKILIFFSSIPLTIFMNSFRIGVIGLLVNYWGNSMAEGFLHDFEGWAVFVLCMVLLFIEMSLFSRINGQKLGFSELVQIPSSWAEFTRVTPISSVLNISVFVVIFLMLGTNGVIEKYRNRVDTIPQRSSFTSFPTQIKQWQGQNEYLNQYYIGVLNSSDYVIINYLTPDKQHLLNFYSAYYQSQRKNATVHSPRSCIPGNGWIITQYQETSLPQFQIDGVPLTVARAIIEKGEAKQLVYFWFQQRGRLLNNELAVKWYIFQDAITLNRTDGALVRVLTDIANNEDTATAEQRLQGFLADLLPLLPDYLPGKSITPASYLKL